MSYENTKKDVEILIDGGLCGKFVFNTTDTIGHGNFGHIFKGRSLYTYEEVAIKLEPVRSMHLLKEYYYYKILGATQRYHNIPGLLEVYILRNIELNNMAIVMELLGPSLYELFISCGNKFSLKTVLMIAIQLISRIEYVHECKLIHRDIRPENLLVGRPHQSLPYKESTENTVYLIDFGMAKHYVNLKTGNHIPYTTEVGIFGTHMFVSAKGHLNIGQSRRDDLESLGYVLVYFVNGTLPWMKYLGKDLDVQKCGEMKSTMSVKDLCAGLPEEFHTYFNYVKRLEYSETPDYEMLRTLFVSVYELNEFPDDNLFDWSSV